MFQLIYLMFCLGKHIGNIVIVIVVNITAIVIAETNGEKLVINGLI